MSKKEGKRKEDPKVKRRIECAIEILTYHTFPDLDGLKSFVELQGNWIQVQEKIKNSSQNK